jgi:acetyl-CoA hydrolase
MPFPILTADEAAALIADRDIVGFSGFTPAGAAKAVPEALARRARAEHAAGRPSRIGVITGASTGPSLDGELARADAVLFRTRYQSDPDLRRKINAGDVQVFDMHLSMLPQAVRYGFFGRMRWAVVEACDVRPNGEIVLTTSVGATPTFCHTADRVIIELNRAHSPDLRGFHDIYEPLDPPHRREIPLFNVRGRIGEPVVRLNPAKIAGIVETHRPDECGGVRGPSEAHQRIGRNVAEFLAAESGDAAPSRHRSCPSSRASATSPTGCSAPWASIRTFPTSRCTRRSCRMPCSISCVGASSPSPAPPRLRSARR